MSEITEEYQDYQLGNFIFRFQSRNFYHSRVVADEWAFYIEHNMPMTRGLQQRITTLEIPFPTRLIPTERIEVLIPEPKFHSPYIYENPADQVFPWPLDPLPSSYTHQLAESTRTTTIPSNKLTPLPDLDRIIRDPHDALSSRNHIYSSLHLYNTDQNLGPHNYIHLLYRPHIPP